MVRTADTTEEWGSAKIGKILLKLAPPVMLAQLIQALYNIVDSWFVGKFSETGLTALSIIYPLQLLMIAFAVGTGVGINTIVASRLGSGDKKDANRYAGIATPLETFLWFVFAFICYFVLPYYANMSTDSVQVASEVVLYGRIVCVGSIGLFLESGWTKVLQANGDMKTPMIAQIVGAIVNIVLDPLLIFGLVGPRMGIAGAAIATIAGQIAASIIVMFKGAKRVTDKKSFFYCTRRIFATGFPNILMQSAYTVYIFGLNMVLAAFSDQAVTALGLYYKWQTFFFIPLGAMQACIVPVISYNYATRNLARCRKTLNTAILFGMVLMAVGTLCFTTIPEAMLRVFTTDDEVVRIGSTGFLFIGVSFLPMVTSLIFPVFFQAIGSGLKSSVLTVTRTVLLFVPLGYLFSRFGLVWFWMTFPVTELLTSILGMIFYRGFLKTSKANIGKDTPVLNEKSSV